MRTPKIFPAAIACMAMLPTLAMSSATWNMGAGVNGSGTSPTCTQTVAGASVVVGTKNVNNVGNAWTCTSTASESGGRTPTMTATAWSNIQSGGQFAAAKLARYTWTTPAPDVYDYGVVNTNNTDGDASSPEHSMDNNGFTDLILLNFSEAVALTSVGIGWYSNDADISVLRYTGSGDPGVGSQTVGGLTTVGGWELIGHYANLQSDVVAPTRTADITSAASSSWWIVSAYNLSYGAGTGSHGGSTSGLDTTNDYVKLLQVAGNVTSRSETPEPGSVALLGAGLLGLVALRRRQGKCHTI